MWKDKLKKHWDENPLAVIAIGAFAATAAAKLLDASTNARNSRVWAKEVDRRVKVSK